MHEIFNQLISRMDKTALMFSNSCDLRLDLNSYGPILLSLQIKQENCTPKH